jgi:hypothetical protein
MKSLLFIIFLTIILFIGCTPRTSQEKSSPSIISIDSFCGVVIADTIIYDVIIRNPNPEDQWVTECLKNLKHKVLIDSLFALVYDKEAIAFDFFSKEPLKIKDIKRIEEVEGFSRDRIGKIQFTERWYFDKSSQQFQKEVLSIVLGYELFNSDSTLRGYKPVFRLNLKHRSNNYSF